MQRASFSPRTVEWIIERCDRWRGPSDFGSSYKEWHHFCVIGENLRLIVNLSLCAERPAPDSPDRTVGRVLILVCQEDWDGGINQIDDQHIGYQPGRIDLRFGESFVRFEQGRYVVHAQFHGSKQITVSMTLQPLTVPIAAGSTSLEGETLRWTAVPRLLASGQVRVGSRTYVLSNAAAYHDHNFGRWRWGGVLSWRWGFAAPLAPQEPWSLVFSEVCDRHHLTAYDRSLSLFHRPVLARTFREAEIALDGRGLFPPERSRQFPEVLRMLAGEWGVDVPREMVLWAQAFGDSLYCKIEPVAVAQLVVPSDVGMGWTTLNEIWVRIQAEGSVGGLPIHQSWEGIFEHVA